ncbi:glycosyltransferase family 2 protein [Candidatus Azambacteria bacterium]|nr:glycosyltransferase family 2 protein [Candidatus Azambacteria bacterium]
MISDEYYYLTIGRASHLTNARERRWYRVLEIVPGALSWGTLALTMLLAWLTPVFIAFFVIAFDIYWFLKTVFLSLHLRSAFKKMRANIGVAWHEKLKEEKPGWEEYHHLILLPMYKESWEVVGASLRALAAANYPKEKMIVVLATEERAGEEARAIAEKAHEEFGTTFFRFVITTHPKDIEGEMAGKGSNINFAGRKAKEDIIDALGIDHKKVIVSAFDIDTVIWAEYFARLMYVYLSVPRPERVSFQPVPFYINNIWHAPAVARVIAFSATFWHMLQQERPERMTTFSSHSMSLTALCDVDFWQPNMVSEDSRIFWQCFLRYDGDYAVEPMYYPVSMDANVADTFWQTLVNQYKQQRRWGYGVENVPYFLFGFFKNKKIDFWKKVKFGFVIIEGFHSWATNALIIFLLGWLPLYLGGEAFNATQLSYNLPLVTKYIMTLSMIGVVTSALLSVLILPPRPPEYGRWKYALIVLQWPLMFLTIIIFGSLPGLDAQTRLMLGKYMGFWVTPKARKG